MKQKQPTLVVSETPSSMWHYHLRAVGKEGIQFGGWPGLEALCGATLGWDTQVPISHYDPNQRQERICDGLFCRECYDIAKKQGLL